jgi:steroid delta-isomerase-like uncharacterized protein
MTHADAASFASRLFDDAVSGGDVEAILDLYSPDFVDNAPGPGQLPGAEGIVQVVRRYREAIPDLRVTVEEVLVTGDRVVTRETWRGTHVGEIAGITGTGRRFEATRMHIFRMEDGLVREEWTAGNILAALRDPRGVA